MFWYYVAGIGIAYGLSKVIEALWMRRKLNRFTADKCPKDVVVMHGLNRTSRVPSLSPFVLKLETFLRMTKIPYTYDDNPLNSFGPKGKTPWISLNGEHIADSQVCIEYLTKKFNVQWKGKYSEKEKAVARLVRVLFEDKIFWEIALWGFVYGGEGAVAYKKYTKLPWVISKYVTYVYKKNAWGQGLGRHSQEVVKAWTVQDMEAVGVILGNNKFLLGDEPCEVDAAAFGFMAQMMWGFPSESPFAKIAREKFPNTVEYCNRMKETFFPDWDQVLASRKKPKKVD